MNEAGTSFVLPHDCSSLQFHVESDKVPSRPVTPKTAEPPYYEAPRSPAPMSKWIDKWMFFAKDDAGKSSFVCVHPRYFVTFRHGTHLQLLVGDPVTIYKAKSDGNESFIATDVQINEMLDFVLLKSDKYVVEKVPPLATYPEESKSFLLAGYGNTEQQLSYLTGVIHLKEYYFHGLHGVTGPFILGTGTSSPGDSGGACWSCQGLIGISLGCTTMPTAPHHSAMSDAAIFSPKIYITPSIFLNQALKMEITKEESKSPTPSPPKKKPCHVINVKGIGIAESYCD